MPYLTRPAGRPDDPLHADLPRAGATERSRGPVHPGRTSAGVALLVGVALIAAVGCAGSSDDRATSATTSVASVVPPEFQVGPGGGTIPATLPIPDNYIAPDTRTVQLDPVPSRRKVVDHTKPLLPMEGGHAKLHGTVLAPDGSPVEGAIVRLQRFVSEDFGLLDVATNKDGKWQANDILGGRYRVRAWRKPDLAVVESQAVFLKADGDAEIVLGTEQHDGVAVQGALDTPEPHVGAAAVFRVFVSQETVDDNGIVQGVGIPAAETTIVNEDDGIKVIGVGVGITNPDGWVLFNIACKSEGDHSITVSSSGQSASVPVPTCLPGSIEDLPPDPATFDVGASFTVPYPGNLPPGTYQATSTGECSTSYEAYIGTAWGPIVSTGRTINNTNPSRSYSATTGTTPCTFKRIK